MSLRVVLSHQYFTHLSRACCLAIALLLTSCAEKTQPTLNIGTNVWIGYEPLYLARDLGFYEEDKVHLVEYASASQVIQAFRNGLIKAAGLTLDEALLLQARGYDIKIVLVMDFSNGADAIVAKRSITTMSELVDKRIGVENNALGAFVLSRALEKAGVTPDSQDSIKIVPLEVSEHEEAFISGDVDAVVTFDPVTSHLVNAGGHVIFDSKQIPGEIVDVLVVDSHYLQSNPGRIQYLLDGWFKALKTFKTQPEMSAKLMGRRLKLDEQSLLQSYTGITLPSSKQNNELLEMSNEKSLFATVENLEKILRDNNLLEGKITASELFVKK